LRLLRCALFGDSIYLRRYPDFASTLIHIDEIYQLVKSRRGSYGHVRGLKYELIGIGHMD